MVLICVKFAQVLRNFVIKVELVLVTILRHLCAENVYFLATYMRYIEYFSTLFLRPKCQEMSSLRAHIAGIRVPNFSLYNESLMIFYAF